MCDKMEDNNKEKLRTRNFSLNCLTLYITQDLNV